MSDSAPEQAGQPRARARARRAVLALAAIVALSALVRWGPSTPFGREMIVRAANGARVGRLGRITLAGLTGDPWRGLTIARLALRDDHGPWLEARDVRLGWRAGSLLGREVRITDLSAADVRVLRRPRLSPPNPPGPSPVSLAIDRLAAHIETAPAFSEVAGDFDLRGRAAFARSGAARIAFAATSRLHRGDYLLAGLVLGARDSDAFAIVARASETSGGALAGALGLDARQPFRLAVTAKGESIAGTLAAQAWSGTTTPARLVAAWSPAGASADGWIDLAASRLLSPWLSLVGPQAHLSLSAGREQGGAAPMRVTVASANLRLVATGPVDWAHARAQGLVVVIDLANSEPLIGLRAGPLDGRFGVAGDPDGWRLAGRASVRRLASGDVTLASVAGPVAAQGRRGAFAFSVGAQIKGFAAPGWIGAMIGQKPVATARGRRLADGRWVIEALAVRGARGSGLATGAVAAGSLRFHGQARFSGERGGIVQADWQAAQARGGAPWTFAIAAAGARLATGAPGLDRLLGPSPRLTLAGAVAGGRWSIENARLTGAAGGMDAAGVIGSDGALALKLGWKAHGPLALGPLELGGAADGEGEITGSLDAPRADLAARVGALDVAGLTLADARVATGLTLGKGGVEGQVTALAQSGYGPASARTRFRAAAGDLALSDIDLEGAGLGLRGAARLAAGRPAEANLAVSLGPGILISAGRGAGRLTLVAARPEPRAALDITLHGATLRASGLVLDDARLQASGPLDRLRYTLDSHGQLPSGEGWRIGGGGGVAAGAVTAVSFSGKGEIAGQPVATTTPIQVRFDGNGFSAGGGFTAAGARGGFTVERAGGHIEGRASLAGLSLERVSSDLAGRLDGALNFAGENGALTGAFQANLAQLHPRGMAEAKPVAGVVRGRLAGGALAIRADLRGPDLTAAGQIGLVARASAWPFELAIARRAPLRGRFTVAGEVAPVWALLMGEDRALSGRIAASGTLGGTLSDPRAKGVASLSGAGFEDAQTGLRLTGVTLAAELDGDSIDVRRFSAADGRGGAMTGSGRVSLKRNGVSTFRLDLAHFRLLDDETARATASGTATIDRASDGRVRLAGELSIDKATIAPNPPVPSGVVPMEVVEIHRPPGREPLIQPGPRPSPIALDVRLTGPRGVFVKGRGLDVEVAVAAHVGGTTADPDLSGTARVVRGDYDFAGKRFLFDTRSLVYLASQPQDIRLDLTATREAPTLTAVIKVTGTAARPKITLASTPALPPDEILSQVLFGASAARLSGLQGAQLASAVASLSGGRGLDVIGGLRSFAHLDRLAFGANTAGEATVSGGKYLKDNVYLELIGSREGPSAQVEWRIRRNLSLVSRAGRAGDSQVSIRWRRDY